MPRRRTFATGIPSFTHPDAAGASPSWLRLATYAGLRGTDSPSLLFREDSFLDSTDARR